MNKMENFPPYPEDLEQAIIEVQAKLGEIAIERARITKEWDFYQGLRIDLQYEQARRNRSGGQ